LPVSLQSLSCSYNDLTELDLSGLTNLKNLYCYNNKLISLPASKLPTSLQSLYCNNNPLTELNLSGLTNLTYLDCSDCKLTSLPASKLPVSLQSLSCSNNPSIELDLSGLTNLTYLDCNYCKLTSLSASNLPVSLQGLYCYYNDLTELDLSGLTNLTYLYCHVNKLTSLDLSGLTSLINVDCRFNFIGDETLVNITGVTSFTDWDIDDGFYFSPQYVEVNINNSKSVANIQSEIQGLLDDGQAPFVTGSKTNANQALVLTIPYGESSRLEWNATYSGNALELKGRGDFILKEDVSMTLTGLTAEGNYMIIYGKLTVNGNFLSTDGYACLYAEPGGEIIISGNAVFKEGELASEGGKITVKGNVTVENSDKGYIVLMVWDPRGEVLVGGNIVTPGIAIGAWEGNITVNGNVTANGDYAIECGYDSIVHVKGNVSAPNGYAIYIYGEGVVKIDGTVTVKDDSEFIWNSDTNEYLSKNVAAAKKDGYDNGYTNGNWSVLVGKQSGGGGGDGGSNLMLIVIVVVIIAIAAAAAYMFVIRPKMKK
ncbi:MAG: leucine-rich repeat domain-containing protein, partial [Methanomassiliicoccaceae archaeon]|nr:leucine-rich repeat domain-containing protein [Methanomassiliicoccaceae archaeon]